VGVLAGFQSPSVGCNVGAVGIIDGVANGNGDYGGVGPPDVDGELLG